MSYIGTHTSIELPGMHHIGVDHPALFNTLRAATQKRGGRRRGQCVHVWNSRNDLRAGCSFPSRCAHAMSCSCHEWKAPIVSVAMDKVVAKAKVMACTAAQLVSTTPWLPEVVQSRIGAPIWRRIYLGMGKATERTKARDAGSQLRARCHRHRPCMRDRHH